MSTIFKILSSTVVKKAIMAHLETSLRPVSLSPRTKMICYLVKVQGLYFTIYKKIQIIFIFYNNKNPKINYVHYTISYKMRHVDYDCLFFICAIFAQFFVTFVHFSTIKKNDHKNTNKQFPFKINVQMVN